MFWGKTITQVVHVKKYSTIKNCIMNMWFIQYKGNYFLDKETICGLWTILYTYTKKHIYGDFIVTCNKITL